MAVVTSVPDEKKGERLIVVHTAAMKQSPQEVVDHLKQLGLPNLWIPGTDSFLKVDEIPALGSGKLDIKSVADLAKSHFCC
jgi:acyl-[acyl-carrier-protein]-phospholipid O-acyltransferase/long-chain-fatty-acid--[acyl-carrier-protein] ligase